MIIRILWVQTKTDLGLETYMKVVLWVKMTTLTVLSITTNSAIRTSYSVMRYILFNSHQNLLKCCQSHSHTQILLKLLKGLHCPQLPFHHH